MRRAPSKACSSSACPTALGSRVGAGAVFLSCVVDAYLDDVPAVVPDYRAGARLGTNHLLRLGHREVGLIAADVDYAFGADTLAGYADALACWGVRFDAGRVRRSAIDTDAARAAAHALL